MKQLPLGSVPAELDTRTAWGRAGKRAVIRIAQIGYKGFLEEQVLEPYIDDPEWCQFIVKEMERVG